MGGREARRVKVGAWSFELFPNPVFAMRIIVLYPISRIHVDDLRDLVRKDSGESLFEGLGEGIKLFYAHHRFRAIFQLS